MASTSPNFEWECTTHTTTVATIVLVTASAAAAAAAAANATATVATVVIVINAVAFNISTEGEGQGDGAVFYRKAYPGCIILVAAINVGIIVAAVTIAATVLVAVATAAVSSAANLFYSCLRPAQLPLLPLSLPVTADHCWCGARLGGSKKNAVNLILRLFLYHFLHTMSL
jgi:hypothetical protein